MKLDLSARSAGIILDFCTWNTNSEMRPRANHCLWHSSVSAPKRKKVFFRNDSLFNIPRAQYIM